jgi:DNA-binding protein H-NS
VKKQHEKKLPKLSAKELEKLSLTELTELQRRRRRIKTLIAKIDVALGDKVPSRRDLSVTYRGPNGERWGGRGQQPRWLTKLVTRGHSKQDFVVH